MPPLASLFAPLCFLIPSPFFLTSPANARTAQREQAICTLLPRAQPCRRKGGVRGGKPRQGRSWGEPTAHAPEPRAACCCCAWRRSRTRLSPFPSICLRPAPPHLEPAPPLLQTAGGRSPLPDPPPRRPCSCLDPAPSRLDLPKPPRPKLGCRFFSTPVPTCYVDRRSFAPV